MKPTELDETFLPLSVISDRTTGSPTDDSSLGRDDIVRVAGFEPRSFVAGPGVRSMVWVAGCHRRCPGCSQPEFFGFDTGREVAVGALWDRIRANPDIDGVSFSGGEPFEQAQPLAALAKLVHEVGKTVVCYTGYRLEALQADRDRFGPLLEEVDLLIDGEYRAELAGSFRWRGSGNQRLICLTDRITLPEETDVTEMQITFDSSGSGLVFSGILSQELIRELRSRLNEQGFSTVRRRDDVTAPAEHPAN